MNISNVTSAIQSNSTNKLSGSRAAQSVNLSTEEQSMIEEKFPATESSNIELYQPTGGSITENPDSRGNNLDFRV